MHLRKTKRKGRQREALRIQAGRRSGQREEPLWIPKEGTFLLGSSLKSSPPPIADTFLEWHSCAWWFRNEADLHLQEHDHPLHNPAWGWEANLFLTHPSILAPPTCQSTCSLPPPPDLGFQTPKTTFRHGWIKGGNQRRARWKCFFSALALLFPISLPHPLVLASILSSSIGKAC